MAIITLKSKTMKTYTSIILFLLFACATNKQLQSKTSNCDFNDKISEDQKIINIVAYKDLLEKKGYFTVTENDSNEVTIVTNRENWRKYIIDKKSNIEKQIIYSKKTSKAVNSFSFFKKGSFNIGNEYIYNEQGQVTQTIDHNQYSKYPICYKEIIKSTIKKAGRKFYFQGLERDSLETNSVKTYSWKVYFEDSVSKYPTLKHKFFRIDAKTGKTITEEIVN
jgi:hypothetical protein